jgi:hypothetical protein
MGAVILLLLIGAVAIFAMVTVIVEKRPLGGLGYQPTKLPRVFQPRDDFHRMVEEKLRMDAEMLEAAKALIAEANFYAQAGEQQRVDYWER